MIVRGLRGGAWFFSSAGAQTAAAALGFFSNVVYARTLPLSSVGEIALVTSAALFSAVFADRGFGTWVTRNIAAQNVTARTAAIFLARASVAAWLIGLVAVVGITLNAQTSFVQTSLFGFAPQWWALLVSFTLFQGTISLTQGTGQTTLRSAIIVVNGASTLGCVLAVAVFGATTSMYLWAGALGYLMAACVGFAGLLRRLRAASDQLSPPTYRDARKEALPLLATNTVTYAMGAGDVLLLALFVGPAQVGLYQTAKKLAQAASLPWSTAIPVLIGQVSRANNPARLVRKFALFSASYFAIATAVAILLGGRVLTVLFGAAFAVAAPELAALTIAFACQVFRDLTGAVLIVRGLYAHTFIGQIVALAGLILMLPLVFLTGSAVVFAGGLAFAFTVGAGANLCLLVFRR